MPVPDPGGYVLVARAMSASAPQSPRPHGDAETDPDSTPTRPSPSKMPRVQQLSTERASSLPARRLSSPSKTIPQIRPRLNQYYTFDHAVSLFKTSKNIIVLTGAGISTSLGVPDFRSSNGVYNLLVDSIYDDPQELFQIDNFINDPKEFFKQAAKVFPKMQGLVPATDGAAAGAGKSANVALVPKYSTTHAFLALLQSKDKLLTNYTQNIDGLELAAGLSPSKLVQCHGTLATATCMSCGKKTTARKYMPVVQSGGIPFCKCSLVKDGAKDKAPQRGGGGKKKKRKRHEFEDSDSYVEESRRNFPKGLLKPDMTFFGEHISFNYAPRLEVDTGRVDLLVIIGTSLQVAPVNDMLLAVPPTVPQIWISKDRCQRQGVKVDIELLGECDVIMEEIARRAGWTAALKERLWPRQNSAPVKGASCKDGRSAQVQPSQDDTAKNKAGQPLQMRPKSIDMTNQKIMVPPAPLDRSKDEARGKSDPRTKTESEMDNHAPVSSGTQGEKSELKAESSSTVNKAARDATQAASKVIIELEEGTRSRWYVKRAK